VDFPSNRVAMVALVVVVVVVAFSRESDLALSLLTLLAVFLAKFPRGAELLLPPKECFPMVVAMAVV